MTYLSLDEISKYDQALLLWKNEIHDGLQDNIRSWQNFFNVISDSLKNAHDQTENMFAIVQKRKEFTLQQRAAFNAMILSIILPGLAGGLVSGVLAVGGRAVIKKIGANAAKKIEAQTALKKLVQDNLGKGQIFEGFTKQGAEKFFQSGLAQIKSNQGVATELTNIVTDTFKTAVGDVTKFTVRNGLAIDPKHFSGDQRFKDIATTAANLRNDIGFIHEDLNALINDAFEKYKIEKQKGAGNEYNAYMALQDLLYAGVQVSKSPYFLHSPKSIKFPWFTLENMTKLFRFVFWMNWAKARDKVFWQYRYDVLSGKEYNISYAMWESITDEFTWHREIFKDIYDTLSSSVLFSRIFDPLVLNLDTIGRDVMEMPADQARKEIEGLLWDTRGSFVNLIKLGRLSGGDFSGTALGLVLGGAGFSIEPEDAFAKLASIKMLI